MVPVAVRTFAELGLGAAVWISDDWWHPIHVASSVTDFEYELGVATRRRDYNLRCFAKAGPGRRVVRGEYAGFHDLFVPIVDASEVRGILVAGPYAKARPTHTEIVERWHALSGARARISDPPFARYLERTLATLTLDAEQSQALETFLRGFAALLLGKNARPDPSAAIEAARVQLSKARRAERMWEATRVLLDAPLAEAWAVHSYGDLANFGVSGLPEHVLVGFFPGRDEQEDAVDARVRRDGFLRECVKLALEHGETLCGKVGDHGVVFLVHRPGPATRARHKLTDLASRAQRLGRRFGLRLHAGSVESDKSALPVRYRAALRAAEQALSQGKGLVFGAARTEPSADTVRKLREELGKSVGDRITLVSPRFDHYIEAVVAYSGYRLETTRAHLEVGLERLVEPLLASALLDSRSLAELRTSLEGGAENARSVVDLVDSYRRAVADIELAVQRPAPARHERGTRRALEFVGEHLAEPLSLAQVAKVAGFAPNYFAALLKRDEGITFARYVQRLRIERAKQMLSDTNLGVEQIQRLSGFRTRGHFHRSFKAQVGKTPAEFRAEG
jgi:AraC-like DNA-binding protein